MSLGSPAVIDAFAAIVSAELAAPDTALTADTVPSDVPGWDSIKSVCIILRLEEHFNLQFAARELGRFRTVGDYVAAIERKLGVASAIERKLGFASAIERKLQ